MGLTESPYLQDDSAAEMYVIHYFDVHTDIIELIRSLYSVIKQLFDYSGDFLAQQYAGSQLVHRIDTYKKLTPAWSTQSRDIIQTFSRYYSNTFSGFEIDSHIDLHYSCFSFDQIRKNNNR